MCEAVFLGCQLLRCCSHESIVVDGLLKAVYPYVHKYIHIICIARRFTENYSLLPHPDH